MKNIKTGQLFWTGCLALLVTALSFGIRAGIMPDLMVQFHLSAKEIGIITGTAFWGFLIAIVLGGFVLDVVGMKNTFILAFVLHMVGIILTVFSTGFYTLFFSTLFIGIANGAVEAAGNPLVTTLYPQNKTTKLNHFHFWFPGGIVIGTLISFVFVELGLNWQWQMATMLIPAFLYGYFIFKLDFPVTERVASGISTKEMYKAVTSPLFIFMFVCMFGTAITELFTNQWVGVLLQNISEHAILLLTLVVVVQAICRAVAGPVVHRTSSEGLLLLSAIVSTIGLYLLSTSSGSGLFVAAIIFGIGVAYFWPTMLGFVSEKIPASGALGINLMGGAGNVAVSVYMVFMGGYYDKLLAAALPSGADVDVYRSAVEGTKEADIYTQAQIMAGPQVIQVTNLIPLALVFLFAGLYWYMHRKRKKMKLA